MANEYSLGMVIDEVCKLDFEEFDASPKHRFSLRNRIRINRLFSQYNKYHHNTTIMKIVNNRFINTAVIIIILATLVVSIVTVMVINIDTKSKQQL